MPPASNSAAVAAPASSRRWVSILVALVVAAALLAAPRLVSSASASTATVHATSAQHRQHHRFNPALHKRARSYGQRMLQVLNKERKAHHLRPLTMNRHLVLSAHRHNKAMARSNDMSHQCPGEKFFADRISKAGYQWLSAGENIGWNSNRSQSGLNDLERQMYHEKAPENGHRLNILDRHFKNIGIDVYFDKKHHKMWFTQDFGQPAA